MLWREAEDDAVRNSFDNALHGPRKLLGGERHVLLRGGSVGLDAASCWTDVGALEACYDEHAAVLVTRPRIQARFIRRIGALGAALEAASQAEGATRIYQRVVEQEPIAEEIYNYAWAIATKSVVCESQGFRAGHRGDGSPAARPRWSVAGVDSLPRGQRPVSNLLPSLLRRRWQLVHVLEKQGQGPDLLVAQ